MRRGEEVREKERQIECKSEREKRSSAVVTGSSEDGELDRVGLNCHRCQVGDGFVGLEESGRESQEEGKI